MNKREICDYKLFHGRTVHGQGPVVVLLLTCLVQFNDVDGASERDRARHWV